MALDKCVFVFVYLACSSYVTAFAVPTTTTAPSIVTSTSSPAPSSPPPTVDATANAVAAKCPNDSLLIDDACECDYEQCATVPDCDRARFLFPKTLTNATDVPGACCPTYACDECPLDRRHVVDGNNACAEATACVDGVTALNARGTCECIDPHKSFSPQRGDCVCDATRCDLPTLCDPYSVPVRYSDGCCENYNCIECPRDSHAYPLHDYTNTEIESKCVCDECEEEEDVGDGAIACAHEDDVMMLVRRGNGFPGTCCDQYECLPSCNANGTVHRHGTNWTDANGDACECRRGISFCRQTRTYASCEDDDGTIYPHDGHWNVDNCTFCKCVDGAKKCISHMCETNISYAPHPPHYRQPTTTTRIGDECPPMDECEKRCAFGYVRGDEGGCAICECKESNALDAFDSGDNATIAVTNVETTTAFEAIDNETLFANNRSIVIDQQEADGGNVSWIQIAIILSSIFVLIIVGGSIIFIYRRKNKYSVIKEMFKMNNKNIKNFCASSASSTTSCANNVELHSIIMADNNNDESMH